MHIHYTHILYVRTAYTYFPWRFLILRAPVRWCASCVANLVVQTGRGFPMRRLADGEILWAPPENHQQLDGYGEQFKKNNSPILVDLSKTIISTKVGFNHHLATNTVTRVFINQHTLTSKSKFEQQNSWFNKRNAWQNQLRIGNNSGAPKFTFGFFTLSKFVECFNIRFLHLEKHISDTTNCLLSRWS